MTKSLSTLIGPRTSAGFWIHFPPTAAHGEQAVRTHVDYFNATGVDLAKVMCENLQPDNGLLTEPEQWRDLAPLRPGDERFDDQVAIMRGVRAAMGPDAVLIATIHSLVASAFHASGRVDDYERDRHIIADHLRADPETMSAYLAQLAESIVQLGDACLASGADGIYLAALGGERDFITDEEHARFIAPLEARILDHFNAQAELNVLHICKENLNLDRFRHYRPQLVNWSVKAPNPTLAEGFGRFPDAVILGGINNHDPRWATATPAETHDMVAQALAGVTDRSRFVVGADCTLDSLVPWEHIGAVVSAVHHLTEEP